MTSDDEKIVIRLTDRQDQLWRNFAKHTTEMVVTKTGRKMFPKLEYELSGLEPDVLYALVLQIEQVDSMRYKFANGVWTASGAGDASPAPKKVWHADGVMTGRQWMAGPVNFDRLKITNNAMDTCGSHIYLHSMHKYVPVLSVFVSPSDSPFVVPQHSRAQLVAVARIPHTEFIAVTAYQNQSVTSLKIAHNPFAKGFRESSDRKRISPSADELADDSSSQSSSPPAKKLKSTSPMPAPIVPQLFAPMMFPYQRFNPFMFAAPPPPPSPSSHQHHHHQHHPGFPFNFQFLSQMAALQNFIVEPPKNQVDQST
ncbi:unnamed protein product [Caenorhabditis bovis]|uniref:T-box domain-containing protein n=1 Tax=Caenorhabditis bovis TaxID=2654633 RepID=A0A8S1EQA9_9PELO|nr:unnamed protein product [Caenorhabditis bovis]